MKDAVIHRGIYGKTSMFIREHDCYRTHILRWRKGNLHLKLGPNQDPN